MTTLHGEDRVSNVDTTGEFIEEHQVPGSADARPQAAERGDATYTGQQGPAQVDERWLRVQAEFVDDPHEALTQAHALVSELVQRVVDSFTHERDELEQQWSQGERVSTEDLRVCLRRYRAFFARLLPAVSNLDMH